MAAEAQRQPADVGRWRYCEESELAKGRWRGARGGQRIVIWRPEPIRQAARNAGISDESKGMRAIEGWRCAGLEMSRGSEYYGVLERSACLPSTVTRAPPRMTYEAAAATTVAGDLWPVWRCGFSAGTALLLHLHVPGKQLLVLWLVDLNDCLFQVGRQWLEQSHHRREQKGPRIMVNTKSWRLHGTRLSELAYAVPEAVARGNSTTYYQVSSPLCRYIRGIN